jgi:Pentapeptide repeats (9 copies)
MTPDEIRADIAAFADNEESVVVERGVALFERDRQVVECRLSQSAGGQVDVEYGGRKMPYFTFLSEELGRLPILAHAIRQKRRDVFPYVDTLASLKDALGNVVVQHRSAVGALGDRCEDLVPGETRLVFLTADAGEGKTALLRRLSQRSAEDYLQKRARWFLLHIDTQGRSFVRLEEAVAGELGQLRVSGLFYSGVVRLVRRGLLAIAIDGFDELLAEIGSGEAYSGLGAFLRQLGGNGVVVAAARSAYFEAENYAAQSRLLSSLPEVQVTVEQMQLEKWRREETLSFLRNYADSDGSRIGEPEALYDDMQAMLGPDHVVLQRPFLVQQLAKMLASRSASAQQIVQDIGGDIQNVVPNVIRAFLKREVEEKWRDPAGQPYLTLDQHIHLLAAISDEMWIQSTNSLPVEMIQLVAETVLEELGVAPSRKVQVLERVKAHALLPLGATMRTDHRAFDHEEFLNYFLAARVAELLRAGDRGRLQRFLERHSLPAITSKWVAMAEPSWTSDQARQLVGALSEICRSELRSGYMKQNAGVLAARLSPICGSGLEFDSMYFEGDAFQGTRLEGCQFRGCMFNEVVLTGVDWTACRFRECQVLGLTINGTRLTSCEFDEGCSVVGVLETLEANGDFRIYVPEVCERLLTQRGATFTKPEEAPSRQEPRPVPGARRAALTSFLRIFQRNTGAVESVIQLKLGQRMHVFETEILPLLLHHGIVKRTVYRGRGEQDRYELNFPLEVILSAEDPDSTAPAQVKAFWQELRDGACGP